MRAYVLNAEVIVPHTYIVLASSLNQMRRRDPVGMSAITITAVQLPAADFTAGLCYLTISLDYCYYCVVGRLKLVCVNMKARRQDIQLLRARNWILNCIYVCTYVSVRITE